MAFLFSPIARAEIVTCTLQSDEEKGTDTKLDTTAQLLFWESGTSEPMIVQGTTTEPLELAAWSRRTGVGISLHIRSVAGTLQSDASVGDSFFRGSCMTNAFTPASALTGGILIGLSAALLLWTTGRIAGISGIVGGLLRPAAAELPWRVAFIIGLIAAPLLYRAVGGATPVIIVTPSLPLVILRGLLVGYGTQLGSGCTSGHGVCGLARLSPRSLAATATFLLVALVTVFVTRHVPGGAP
jgi:uncharacterized membrane protein YedE/YeeE